MLPQLNEGKVQESKVTFSDEEEIHRGEMTDTLNTLESISESPLNTWTQQN